MPLKELLEWAEKAKNAARLTRRHGSGNKWRPGTTERKLLNDDVYDRETVRAVADGKIVALRDFIDKNPQLNPIERAELAAKEGVGNCKELAMIAFSYLWQNGVRPLEIVDLASPGDHVFTVLGVARPEGKPVDGDFAKWGMDVVVCDPWANIACAAADYPAEWKKKMAKWAGLNKKVWFPHKNAWVLPTDKEWLESVETCVKKVGLAVA